MKEKPGVMLYFDRLPYLNRMTREQRGDLFLFIMEYAQFGVVPQIEDAMLGMAWDVVKPAIDLDTERYEAKCERNAESARKRWKNETDANAYQIQNQNQNKNKLTPKSKARTRRPSVWHRRACRHGRKNAGAWRRNNGPPRASAPTKQPRRVRVNTRNGSNRFSGDMCGGKTP